MIFVMTDVGVGGGCSSVLGCCWSDARWPADEVGDICAVFNSTSFDGDEGVVMLYEVLRCLLVASEAVAWLYSESGLCNSPVLLMNDTGAADESWLKRGGTVAADPNDGACLGGLRGTAFRV